MLRYKTETRPGLVACTISSQETEQVNSYNPGAHTRPSLLLLLSLQFRLIISVHSITWFKVQVGHILIHNLSRFLPRAGSGVARIDLLRFLAECRTRRLNQV